MKKDLLTYLLWVLCATIWTALCFIAPDFIDNPIGNMRGLWMVTAFVGACSIAAFLLLYAIGSSKYLTAVLLPLWSLSGSVLAFYRVGYRVSLTPMLIDVTLHTNWEEAFGVISWQLIGWVVLHLLIAVLLIGWRWRMKSLPCAWLQGLVAFGLCFVYVNAHASLTDIVLNHRFPINIAHHTYAYIKSLPSTSDQERTIPAYRIMDVPDSLTVVLVIGEATRADHLSLNGYERETTPRLAKRQHVVSYPHIFSEQTFTEACMPYLLTRADSAQGDYQYTETSFISVFRDAGFYTAWLSNQDLESTSYRHFILESDTVIFANAGKSVFVYSQWLDEDLLPILTNLHPTQSARSIYVLHTIGSHWYYNNHASDEMKQFMPVTTSRVVANNSVEQLVNSYDNTILYWDYWMDSLISILEHENAIVLFQSDHGESLGEDGYYLHGHAVPSNQNPACVVWYSDSYAAKYADKVNALEANKDKRYRTDYLFYSILSAAGLQADSESETVNIFR